MRAGGDHPLARAVSTHYAQGETPALLLGKGQQVTARRPDGRAVIAGPEADAALARAVCIHHIDLLAAAPIGLKSDLAAVRREGGRGVDARIAGETLHGAA